MDDQQERPILSKEFVAGLLVGEGYFGLTVQKNQRVALKHGFQIIPSFAIEMNDIETMESLIQSFTAWNLTTYISRKDRSLRVSVRGHKRVYKVIKLFEDVLTGDKARSAAIVKEFIELRFSKPQPAPYGDEELACVERIRKVNAQRNNAITAAELKELHSLKRYNRTTCSRGHELTPENTAHYQGRKVCRKCKAINKRAYRARLQKESESSETTCSAPL